MANDEELSTVLERFESSERTLKALAERLRVLREAEEEADKTVASLRETLTATRKASAQLAAVAESSSEAQEQLRVSLEAAEEFLESTDLAELRSSVANLEQRMEELETQITDQKKSTAAAFALQERTLYLLIGAIFLLIILGVLTVVN